MPFWTYKIIFIILEMKVILHCLTFLPYKAHYIITAFLSPTIVWTFFNTWFICLCKVKNLENELIITFRWKKTYILKLFFFTGLQGFHQKHRT
jgi:hypothetical protein